MGERTEIRTRVGPLWPGMVHCRCGLSVALQSAEGYWRTEGKTIRDEIGLRCPDCRDLLVRDTASPDPVVNRDGGDDSATPDREALIEAGAKAITSRYEPTGNDRALAATLVDALLSPIADALDQAERRGEARGKLKGAEAMLGVAQTMRDFIARCDSNQKDET